MRTTDSFPSLLIEAAKFHYLWAASHRRPGYFFHEVAMNGIVCAELRMKRGYHVPSLLC